MSTKAKQRLGQQVDRIAHAWEPAFARDADEAFTTDLRALLRIIRGKGKAEVNWLTIESEAMEYMRQISPGQWQAQFVPAMEGVITSQAEMWEGMGLGLGTQFDISNLFAQAWFDDYTLTFAQEVNETTIEALGVMFQQAQAEGWSIRTMEGYLETMFGQWMTGTFTSDDFDWYADRMPLWRRELIARTETMRSNNTGTFNLFEFWAVPMKEWNDIGDKRTRDSHLDAGRRYQEGGDPGPIPMSEPFIVSGVPMMYPHDSSAPAKEVVNCRCSLLPVIAEDLQPEQQTLLEGI